MANVSSWPPCVIVPQCDHEETLAILLSLSEHHAVENAVANAILSKQQECILENVSTISVELSCILVARSCIIKKRDTLVLKALRMCDVHDLRSMGVEVFRGMCDKLPLIIQIVHGNIFTVNQCVSYSI
jgi:hypothetical protein